MQGIVWSRVTEMQKERFISLRIGFNFLNGMVGKGICRVKVVGELGDARCIFSEEAVTIAGNPPFEFRIAIVGIKKLQQPSSRP